MTWQQDQPAGGPPPTCYRHPDRETYVRCGRCGRFICPDDMISASVGFQCHECVRSGNKDVRVPRTVTGGALRLNTGVVTTLIVAINIAVFFAVQVRPQLLPRLWLSAYATDGHGVAQGGWYRLFTGAFLHQQTWHIAMNMFVLWIFGRPLEAQLGRSRYIATYLICALGGSTASYMFNASYAASLGASGAVFGLIGALLVVERRFGANTGGVLIYLAILLVPGMLISDVDWHGHIGGLVTGFALGALWAYAPRANRLVWHVAGAAAICVILAALIGARTHSLNRELTARFDISGLVVPNVDNACAELHTCN
ncbi:MAG TPA: rhomboid family intramembrane serine protease [Sporichthyaceae bacterium]|jgi:membrane associated rhomboid family serine protease|nr:rhomboid family intramembrane serine protease [Sporichthyaceae bacterium]